MTQAIGATRALIRLSVQSEGRRLDIGIPAQVPLIEFLPGFARSLGVLDPTMTYAGYALQRADGTVLDASAGAAVQGVEDGEVLTLARGGLVAQPRVYDDVVEAVIDATAQQNRPWTAKDNARTALMVSLTLLGVCAVLLLAAGPSLGLGAFVAAGGAVALLVVATVVGRLGQLEAGQGLGIAAAAFAGIAGYLAVPASFDLWGWPLAAAGGAAFIAAGVALALTPERAEVQLAPLVAGGVLAVTATFAAFFPPAPVYALMIGVAATLSGSIPWLALGTTRVRVISPQSDADMFADPVPIDPADVARRMAQGGRILIALRVALGLVVLAATPLVASQDAVGAALCTLAFAGMMFPSRQTYSRTGVLAVMAIGTIGLAVSALTATLTQPDLRIAFLVVLTVATVCVVTVTLLSPKTRMRMLRMADTLELLVLAALLPLAVIAEQGWRDAVATKSDLIEAQNFSRKRLLTAFVSGAPGGKELQPAAPMRAVAAAIALALLVVLVGVFYGFIRPGLPQGWDNGKLVLVTDTGARFVTVEGVLHPVINTASARLLLPSSGFDIISTDQQSIADSSIGDTLGIVGAPDELPAPSGLTNTGWTACVADDAALDVRIGGESSVRPATGQATVVETDGVLYVLTGERSFAVEGSDSDAVLRAAGITSLDPTQAPTDWLNLFTPGSPLAPLEVSGFGEPVAGTDLLVGAVVHVAGTPDADRLLVQSDGSLAALTPLAWQLYQLGSGSGLGGEVAEVSASEVAGLATAARPAGGSDWPDDGFPSIDADQRPCAILAAPDDGGQAVTALAMQDPDVEASAGIRVEPGHGAFVRAGGRGDQSTGIVTLVDATGTAYAVPGATEETILRLGYDTDDLGAVADGWTALLRTGPALSEEAAGRSPTSEPE